MQTACLACPVCEQPMVQNQKTLRCLNGHSFDLAAKGYVNFLTDAVKNSLNPGDSKEMVSARKRFLQSGAYDVLQKELLHAFSTIDVPVKTLVDAGCGEGTFTSGLEKGLPPHTNIIGIDISKNAIVAASAKSHDISWIVASLYHLPILPNSVDCVVNIFAPSSNDAFARILKKDGTLITAIPGKSHLWGLKSILYEEPYENDEGFPAFPSFKQVGTLRASGTLKMAGNETIQDLLAMTPYFWKSPKEGIARLNVCQALETPIDFLLGIYQKSSSET